MKIEGRRLAAVIDAVETVAQRIVQAAKSCIRKTDGADITQAGTVQIQSQSLLSVDAQHGVINTRGELRINGEHVHIA